MTKLYMIPSFYAHLINGIVLLLGFVVLYKHYSKITNIRPYDLFILILIISISIGVHGLLHLGLEKAYGYNPIQFIYNSNDLKY